MVDVSISHSIVVWWKRNLRSMCQPGKCSDASMSNTTGSCKQGRMNDRTTPRTRRSKRDRNDDWLKKESLGATRKKKVKKKSTALRKHGKDSPSGGIEAMFPSLIGLGVLVFAVMAQQGFRGRASVAGIDLGTTNSVICVQAPSKGVGEIECIPDPDSGSAIIVGFLPTVCCSFSLFLLSPNAKLTSFPTMTL